LLLAIAAPLGAALYSAVSDDLFIARNLLSSLPALTLAMGALLVSLPRALAIATLAAALVALGVGAVGTFDTATRRPAYDEAGAFIREHARSGDVVLELRRFPDPPGRALAVHLDPDQTPLTRPRDAVSAARERDGRIFYMRPEIDQSRDAEADLARQGFDVVERRSWDGRVALTVLILERR
jgi:hypothetical protein